MSSSNNPLKMSMYDEFLEKYRVELEKRTNALADLADKDMIEAIAEFEGASPSEFVAKGIDLIIERELLFVKKVLDSLEKIEGKPVLYWDLDNTLLSSKYQGDVYCNIIRPSAPLSLEYLRDKGYEHGIFSIASEKSFERRVQNQNMMNSILPYFAKDKIHRFDSPDELSETKGPYFITHFDNGVLIDDAFSVINLEHTKRVINIGNPIYADYLLHGFDNPVSFIKEGTFNTLFGPGI
jgi:hypothetical protein